MFRKRRLTNSGASGSDSGTNRSKRQRIAEGAKILLDIAKESSDWCPPLKSALGGMNTLIKHYEQFEDVKEKVEDLIPQLDRFKHNIARVTVNEDPEEMERRLEFSSALENIEKRSQELLAKGTTARFVDKRADSGEVVKLVERLREAFANYQISQQQAIYDRITDLTSSFGALFRLHEGSPVVKNKLDSVAARLDRLRSDEGYGDGLWDENMHEQRAKLFKTLGLIRDNGIVLRNRVSAQGYEECQGDILAVSGMAEDIRDALLDYQMARQRAIYDRNCRLIDAEDLSVMNGCRRARGAGYQHGDRRDCLRGTRETVLNEIELWVKDFNKSPVFWLNGLAGTGKTTIAQTVSERIFADELLGASFFCSRDFEDRSDLHFIFPTLAFQLAHKYPRFRSVLVPLLRSNPDVVYESLYSQVEKLIVGPLKSADISTVIVIDALDECTDEEPSSAILSVLGRFVVQIPKVKFFITGRPEPRIRTGFRLPLLVDSTDVFVLHDVDPSLVNDDIRLFLKHELSELAKRHRLEGWPNDEHINLMCLRAAGLFIYAVATVKFLDSNSHLPERRLDAIVNLPESTVLEGKTRFKPRTTLDSLYTSVLEMAFSDEDPEVDSKVRSTIGAVVLLVNPLPPPGIAELIGLDPREVMLFLTSVQSLLILDEDPTQPVKPFHKSFPDFITDPLRCAEKRFYVSPGNLHLELATNCLKAMNNGLKQNLLSLPNYAMNSEVGDLQARIENRIGIALQYACQCWYNHLAKTSGDVNDVVSYLRIFLKEKFLAWLEVLSVLGALYGAVAALKGLITWLQEVAGEEELLDIVKGHFYFVTMFFEPINASAMHIYHSALELSPLSSAVQKLYGHGRPTAFPRVAVGVPDSWYPSVAISTPDDRGGYFAAWSPCGLFIATQTGGTTEIRDAYTFELLSTLQLAEPTSRFTGSLAYSPDGRSLACASGAAVVVWDIQTGGVTKKIPDHGSYDDSPVWSLDGSMVCTIGDKGSDIWIAHTYDVASGTILFPATLQSQDRPRLWAHGESFRVMTTTGHGKARTVDILEVGPAPTKIESFPIQRTGWIGSFSPATYRISVSTGDEDDKRILVLDIRNPGGLLLDKEGSFCAHCFSSDGGLFAGFGSLGFSGVIIWKYDCHGRLYNPWRRFPLLARERLRLQFSPTCPSILGHLGDTLRLWRLNCLSYASAARDQQLAVVSRSGVYTATACKGGSTVTITNLLSRSPSQFIDTDVEVLRLGLIGNVLLVVDFEAVVAWLLTEDGFVNGVSGNRRAGRGDSIWTVPTPPGDPNRLRLLAEGETGLIESDGRILRVYNTSTGRVLEPTRAPQYSSKPLDSQEYSLSGSVCDTPCENYSTKLEGNWLNDPHGKHLLWLPVGWREQFYGGKAKWFPDIATIQFESLKRDPVIIKLN